jgi:uncharacterized secreted protein with C-terminal beta-propeller domain
VSLVKDDPLPAVGDKETLLLLLKERGGLYDATEYSRLSGWNAPGMEMDDADNGAMPAPQEAPQTDMMAEDGDALALRTTNTETEAGGSHSETNEQSEGVSEGDIVKTDGKYLYAMSGEHIRIIEVSGSSMKVVSTIKLDDIWGTEFYLMGDKIAVIGQHHIPFARRAVEDDSIEPYHYWGGRNSTVLLVYDITDRAAPAQIRRVEQEGWSISTRVIGDVVYMVTNKSVWAPFERADSEMIIPYAGDSDEGDGFEPISFDRIYYIPDTDDTSYLIVGALDISSGDAFEPSAYLGAGSMIYMSRNALYIVQSSNWNWRGMDGGIGTTTTDILRFEIDGTNVGYTGKGSVSGFPINQYSMDEYNGFFRIATTQWGVGTRVTVLDINLDVTGHTEDLEPDEMMHSMRFMGDMGYVVTFENTDPLFTIDLSDPYNPTVLGELKIPGFSQYLHPVGDGWLLGIGRHTTELFVRNPDGTEEVVGFHDLGLKVSLFDVRDPHNPLEADVILLGEGWAEVSHNPRAMLCDPARGLYGFTIDRWNDRGSGSSAQIIRVEDGKLSVAAELGVGNNFYTWGSRLAFIGDTLYLVHEQGVIAYNYTTFARIGTIVW